MIDPNAATQTLNGQDGDIIELSKSENPTPMDGYITIRLRQPSKHVHYFLGENIQFAWYGIKWGLFKTST